MINHVAPAQCSPQVFRFLTLLPFPPTLSGKKISVQTAFSPMHVIISLFALLLSLAPTLGWSIEVAPRISDREIIERLTRLEEGQKALGQRLNDMERSLNQRIDALDKRIDGLDKRIDGLDKRIDGLDKRIDEVNRSLGQRIDALDRRIDELRQTMQWGFGVLFSGMLGLVGFILWDRRSALAPAVRHMEDLKVREERLEAALREYARSAPELAEALRKLGLL